MGLNISINFKEAEDKWIIVPEGELDIFTSPNFKEKVLESFEKNKTDILINGEKLEYVDSTGLGSLISILKKVKESDKKIYLDNIKPNIKKLFVITELDKLFIIRSENND